MTSPERINTLRHQFGELAATELDPHFAMAEAFDRLTPKERGDADVRRTLEALARQIGLPPEDAVPTPPKVIPRALSGEQLKELLLAFAPLVVRPDTWGMSAEHYARVVKACHDAGQEAPVLVFGCGMDGRLWRAAVGGRLVFVEDDPDFARRARVDTGAEVRLASYTSRVGRFMEPVKAPEGMEGLLPGRWDLAIVDGPVGGSSSCAGREQSVYAAALAREARGTAVFLHDYERTWERSVAVRHLGAADEVTSDARGRELAFWKSQWMRS